MDVLRQVLLDLGRAESGPRRPNLGDLFERGRLQSMIARLLEHGRNVQVWARLSECILPYRPKCEDKWFACEPVPFLRQIERDVTSAINVQRRIADNEPGIAVFKHPVQFRSHGAELASSTPELLEQHAGERDRG